MDMPQRRPAPHPAFAVVAVVFLVLLVGAGLRGAPGVLLQPFERSFGWSRSQTSFAAAVGIFLYGLMGPFAAALMQSFGLQRVVVCALLLMAASTGSSVFMTQHWQLVQGNYIEAFSVAGASGVVAAVLALSIGRRRQLALGS